MKKFISLLATLLVTYEGFAATTTYTGAASNGANILANQPVVVNRIDVSNATGSAATVVFVDAPGAVLTYVTGAYTNKLQYSTNVITSWTAFTGTTYTETNTVVFTVPNTVAQATNNFRILTTLVVPANSTASWVPVGFTGYAGFGLAITNSATVTANVNYGTPR